MPHWFTTLFLACLTFATGLRLWLAMRQINHVQACRHCVPRQFAGQISLQAHQTAADYSCAKTRLHIVAVLFETILLLALTLGGALQWIDDLVAAQFAPGIVRGIALIGMAVLLMTLAEIPLNLYRTFVIEARFGFNKMTLKLFFLDMAKSAAIAAALGAPLVALVLWLMQRMGENWWIYVWLTWVGFNLLILTLYPSFIAPLFNKFSPLANAELKARIEALLVKCGFRSKGLFVMDGSKRSSHGNAYFTGFGAAKRIVFFDTLLARLEPPEIEAVLAHELGHFKLRHVLKRMTWVFALSLGFLWLLAQLMEQEWFYRGLGVTTASTAMALLLFVMVVPVFTFLLQPLASMYSRKHEFEADRYAASNARAEDLVHALVKLYKDNASTLTPDPLHSAVYDSHPPAAVRIARLQAGGG
jgi:STE24 endopeptidase